MLGIILIIGFITSWILIFKVQDRVWIIILDKWTALKKKIITVTESKNIRNGKNLLFLSMEWGHGRIKKQDKQHIIPEYKSYGTLMSSLLVLHHQLGAPISEALDELRSILIKDLHFEEKLKKKIQGSWLQIVLMLTGVWGLMITSHNILEQKGNQLFFYIIGAWQLVGFYLWNIFLKKMMGKHFIYFNETAQRLYLLKTLLPVQIDFQRILNLINPLKNFQETCSNHSGLQMVNQLQEKAMFLWKREGVRPINEINRGVNLLSLIYEELLESFVKKCETSKLVILSLFILAPYLLFLSQLLVSMEQELW